MSGPRATAAAPAADAVDGGADGVAGPAGGGGAGTVRGADAPSLWRRYRVVLVVAAVMVVAAVVVAIARSRGGGGRLDPRSVDPEGGRALATLLDDRGVQVNRVTDPARVADGLDDRTVVLVTVPGQLRPDAADALGRASAGTVVLVGPADDELSRVSERVRTAGITSAQVREPDCGDPAAVAAGSALTGDTTYATDDGETCYRDDDAGSVVTGTTTGGARLVVLGTGATLTNQRLDEDGNAALALNLLGGDGSADELRWLVPSPGASDGESTGSILPGWVLPAMLQLLLAGALLALWRGRRLGPPVIEPLPVVVRAAEAVEGRARLYRRAQARDRAADALRSGALARMVPRLGIDAPTGGEPPPDAVVAAVAARSGRPDAAVHAVLYGPPPADDAGLVTLAGTLDTIVRDTLDPEGPKQ